MNVSDVLIIGAGPGGYETAVKAHELGKTVTLIERDELGGTCLNRGCIPTKALCRAAEVAQLVASAAGFGIESAVSRIDFPGVMRRKSKVVEDLREGVSTLLKNVNVVKGEASFASASEVVVNGQSYTAPEILIATGSEPAMLNIPGKELALTSDEILSLETLPQSLAIIGGGVIGMEFASIFAAMGVDVTVIEYCKEILPPFDSEIAKRLRMSLKRRNINILTNAELTSIAPGIKVNFSVKGKEKSIDVEKVLMAVGRKAVLPAGIESVGAKISRGALVVDDSMRLIFETEKPKGVTLYAIGDVNGRCMLAHAASMHGEIALGLRTLTDVIPSAVFTMPECAMVGMTEEQCAARGINIRIGRSTFLSNGKAVAMGSTDGLVKIIVDTETDRIIGGHICGAHAADLIQEIAIAVNLGLTAKEICSTVHPHPTLSELIKAAIP